jgi:histone arginine demethylase JMJD6
MNRETEMHMGCAVSEFIAADTSAAAMSGPVPRRSGLSVHEFREEFLLPRRPVIISDAAEGWPIYGRGTPDYFRSVHGEHRVRVLGEDICLADLIDRLEDSSSEKPGPYPCKFEIAKQLQPLLADVSPRIAHSMPDRQASALLPQRLFAGVNNLEIFFGGPGGKFPYLHYDVMHLHAWITQLHGAKEFTLYAPGQESLLYVNPDLPWQSTIRNHHNPDYTRYPLLRAARAQRVVINAGETLFLPCGWWHTARSLTFTISVAFDQLGADNWDDFVTDVVAERRRCGRHVRAFALGAYLHAAGALLSAAEALGANRRADWGTR